MPPFVPPFYSCNPSTLPPSSVSFSLSYILASFLAHTSLLPSFLPSVYPSFCTSFFYSVCAAPFFLPSVRPSVRPFLPPFRLVRSFPSFRILIPVYPYFCLHTCFLRYISLLHPLQIFPPFLIFVSFHSSALKNSYPLSSALSICCFYRIGIPTVQAVRLRRI